jgi:NodT family efflux transporter outer membrane factor (OMF) lipoprotein
MTTRRQISKVCTAAALCGVLLFTGCDVGPKYSKATAQTPPAYKELTPDQYKDTDGWKVAQPKDDALRGKWWEIFGDEKLNALEEQITVSNQSIAAAAAGFLSARALVRQARSQYYPTVAANPAISYDRIPITSIGSSGSSSGSGSGSSSGSSNSFLTGTFAEYALPFDATWQPDLWGRVRNMVRANVAAAQASAADLVNVRLTVEAEVAQDYFQLRSQDALKELFDETIAAYKDSLDLTNQLYNAGLIGNEAVAQAETQLDSTEAQETNLGILRAQYEHAIAMLVGQPASTFSIAAETFKPNPPAIPIGVPADLLERRPDIAMNERLMAQANAQIGVAKAAYYPNVTLSAAAGFENISITSWFTWPSRFWALGPSLAETIFDAGLRNATMQQYRSQYDQTVANYRQSVLTGFQQVEDSLAELRILSKEVDQQDAAVQAANRSLQTANQLYKAGIDPYLDVITAQTALLTNRQTGVVLRTQQMTASVQLIEALGGGWNSSTLPAPDSMKTKTPPAMNPSGSSH